jgi:hypothetical protein
VGAERAQPWVPPLGDASGVEGGRQQSHGSRAERGVIPVVKVDDDLPAVTACGDAAAVGTTSTSDTDGARAITTAAAQAPVIMEARPPAAVKYVSPHAPSLTATGRGVDPLQDAHAVVAPTTTRSANQSELRSSSPDECASLSPESRRRRRRRRAPQPGRRAEGPSQALLRCAIGLI